MKRTEILRKKKFLIFLKFYLSFSLKAQCRNQQPLVQCTLQKRENFAEIYFYNTVWAITPGQVMAFYDNNQILLGSGYITDYFSNF